MPDPNKTMIVRPLNCTYCGHGYYGLYHVVEYARSLGWGVVDMSAGQAMQGPVFTAIDMEDPGSFYGFGHGNDCRYTGDTERDIFNCEECDRLAGRIVYLLSCLTANGLGPAIMENGAINYAGFDIEWTWISESGTEGDPYADSYAHGFWESANELWMAHLDGYNFHETIQCSIDKYNEWIDYWYDHPEDPSSDDCIMWLLWDRDGLVGLPAVECGRYATQEECEMAGCRWNDGFCQSEVTAGINWTVAIPILLIVGIAFLAFKK